MKKTSFLLVLITLAIVTGSCRKDDNEVLNDNVYLTKIEYHEHDLPAPTEYEFYYDSLGRLIKYEFRANYYVRWAYLMEYNENGDLRKKTNIYENSIDFNTYDSTYYYYYYSSINGSTKLDSVVTPKSTIHYAYDKKGKLNRVYNQYIEKKVQLDELGRIIAVFITDSTGDNSFYYTWQGGNIIKVVRPSNKLELYSYDTRPNVNLTKHLPFVMIQEACLNGNVLEVNKNNIIKKTEINTRITTYQYTIQYYESRFPSSIWINNDGYNSYSYIVK